MIVDQIVFWGKTIQKRLPSHDGATTQKTKTARNTVISPNFHTRKLVEITVFLAVQETLTFAQLTEEKNANKGGILPLNDEEAFEILQQKLPKDIRRHATKKTLQEVHPVICEFINSEMVKGEATGPSGMDTDGWYRILISGNFGNVGEDF